MTKSSSNRQNLHIRLLQPSDFGVFWPVRLLALQESPQAFGASYEESMALPEQEAVTRLSPKDGGFVLGAFAGELLGPELLGSELLGPELLGMAGLARHPGMKVRHKATIWGVYVVPTARGGGVARQLMEKLLEQCQTIADLEEVTLSVVSTNQSAKRLYQSLGFGVYGLEKRALKVGKEYYDEELMALRLFST